MDLSLRHFRIDEGGFLVEALCQRLGNDYLVAIWGGAAHIGAVAMAQPRPSLADPARMSASASVFCYVGHKEDELAKKASEKLAAALEAKVVVTAGLHWDNLKVAEIEQIVSNVFAVIELIVKEKEAGAS
jgi:gallate decarboxylase subunit D